jgi:hypothetical protein
MVGDGLAVARKTARDECLHGSILRDRDYV